jgi:glycopeptide antibiotics resistance protein
MLTQLAKLAALTLAIGLPAWAFIRLGVRRHATMQNRKISASRELFLLILFAWLLVVAALTVMPAHGPGHQEAGLNLVPIVDLLEGFRPRADAPPGAFSFYLQDTIGNLLLFFPLGVLLPVLWDRFRSVGQVLIVAGAASFLIELTQYLWQFLGGVRTADIDDVILNTLGAGIGALISNRVLSSYRVRRPQRAAAMEV